MTGKDSEEEPCPQAHREPGTSPAHVGPCVEKPSVPSIRLNGYCYSHWGQSQGWQVLILTQLEVHFKIKGEGDWGHSIVFSMLEVLGSIPTKNIRGKRNRKKKISHAKLNGRT